MWDKDELLAELELDEAELAELVENDADPQLIQAVRDQIDWVKAMLKD